MDLSLNPRTLRIFQEDDKGEVEVDLTEITPGEFFRNDIVRCRITGVIPSGLDFRTVNFVGCVLHGVKAEGVDFSECDFKDTLLKEVIFIDCVFNDGAFATTFFSDAEFRRCTFYNLAAHSSDFNQVHFVDCDLRNLLVKSSRFSQCLFTNCATSNKICELSTLFDVTFADTSIQIDTITNNFGLTLDGLKNAPVRSKRTRDSYDLLGLEDLKSFLSSQNLAALERLSLEYFLNCTLLNGSTTLDESLDITQWTRIYKNPGSFVELLDKFAEFLVHLYEEGKLAVHTILLLHHVTSTLIDSISLGAKLHRVAMSLGGIHLILSRIAEDYLFVLDLASKHSTRALVFRAEGPTDPAYFETILEPWMRDAGITISRLERNSPLTIEFTSPDMMLLLPLLAVFIATRTKLEITRLKTDFEKSDKHKRGRLPAKRSGSQTNLPEKREDPKKSIFSISSGWVTAPTPAYELRVRSLMPGSLLVDLRLNFSTTLVHRVRSVLLTLLTGSSSKSS